MAARTIENENDRRMTVITTSFIPCGAKLPVIAMIAEAFFGGRGWVAFGAYFLGIAAVVISGIILKKTPLFKGEAAPFVMELPAYRLPSLKSILITTWDRVSSFVKKASTIILLAAILLWFVTYFGWVDGRFQMLERAQIDNSIVAAFGNLIAWFFKPLGWGEWRPVVAALSGLVAKETVVTSFGIFYGFSEAAEAGHNAWAGLRANFTPLTGASFLVFVLLSAPCIAAISSIRQEMNSSKWTAFAVGYMSLVGYMTALVIFQIGTWLQTGFSFWTGIALGYIALVLWLMLRPAPTAERAPRIAKKEA